MANSAHFLPGIRPSALLCFSLALPGHAQGGKEFFEWAKLYSPTSVFIITEAEKSQPGFHKQFVRNEPVPVPAVAVHESCHMFNFRIGGNENGGYGYYVGNFQSRKVTINFQPFNSKKIAPDIPANMRTGMSDLYITTGIGGAEGASMIFGAWGIMNEYSAYGTGLKSCVEFATCIKANFDQPKNWGVLALDAQPSVEASQQFRYFTLRYILHAKKNYPDIYEKTLTSQQTREAYSAIVQFHAQTILEWKAVLAANKMDTLNDNGFDVYRKFRTELEKQEYVDLEKLLIIPVVAIAPKLPDSRATLAPFFNSDVSVAILNMQGKVFLSTQLNAGDARSFRSLWREASGRFGDEGLVIRLSNGKVVLTERFGAFPALLSP